MIVSFLLGGIVPYEWKDSNQSICAPPRNYYLPNSVKTSTHSFISLLVYFIATIADEDITILF